MNAAKASNVEDREEETREGDGPACGFMSRCVPLTAEEEAGEDEEEEEGAGEATKA
jgi:hypothetical protein|eukprot:evm.model.NODE_18772_length_9920_cov_42.954235.2